MSLTDYKDLAEACVSSYKGNTWSNPNNVVEFTDGAVACYFVRHVNSMQLVFRGSDDAVDWWHNVRFTSLFTHGVHAGTYKQFNRVWPRLLAFIKKHYHCRRCRKIDIGGHSLGGALALLTIHQLYAFGYPIDQKLTLGCPAIFSRSQGPREAKAQWAQGIVRVVNGSDIVPRMLNWRRNVHIGELHRIGDQAWRRWPWKSISDHLPKNYLKNWV